MKMMILGHLNASNRTRCVTGRLCGTTPPYPLPLTVIIIASWGFTYGLYLNFQEMEFARKIRNTPRRLGFSHEDMFVISNDPAPFYNEISWLKQYDFSIWLSGCLNLSWFYSCVSTKAGAWLLAQKIPIYLNPCLLLILNGDNCNGMILWRAGLF